MPIDKPPKVAGRRRKTGRRKTKKLMKGGFYGFNGAVSAGAPNWKAGSEMGGYAISGRGGNTHYGAGRRRKGKGKKGKKTMRGGSKYGGVSASYMGSGSRGMANFGGVSINKPGFATQGEFNDNGAHSLADRSNFITTAK